MGKHAHDSFCRADHHDPLPARRPHQPPDWLGLPRPFHRQFRLRPGDPAVHGTEHLRIHQPHPHCRECRLLLHWHTDLGEQDHRLGDARSYAERAPGCRPRRDHDQWIGRHNAADPRSDFTGLLPGGNAHSRNRDRGRSHDHFGHVLEPDDERQLHRDHGRLPEPHRLPCRDTRLGVHPSTRNEPPGDSPEREGGFGHRHDHRDGHERQRQRDDHRGDSHLPGLIPPVPDGRKLSRSSHLRKPARHVGRFSEFSRPGVDLGRGNI